MKIKKLLSTAIAITMLLTLFTACGSDGSSGSGGYRSVTVALTAGSFDLSPFGADGGPRDVMVDNLYGYLACIPVFGAPFEEMTGDLAKSMTLSDDGLTCTVELYDYIHDSKGNPITADDVVFCYNYCIGLSGRNDFTRVASYLDSIRAVDDYTVEITASTTGVGVMETLLAVVPIVNREWFESASDDEKTSDPAVTGSYYIAELVSDSSVTMRKVEDYWQADSSLRTYVNHQPVDEIYYTVITETSMRTIALQNGEVDVAQIAANEAYHFVNDDGGAQDGWTAHSYSSSRFSALMFNCAPGLLFSENQALRQAICYAIDAEQVMLGSNETHVSAQVCKDFGSSLASNYNRAWLDQDYYEYNLDRAKALMAEAGYPDGGLTLRLMTSNTTSRVAGAAVVQAELAELGIEVELISYDNALWSTYKTDFTQWDILIDSYSTTGYCSDAWNRLDRGDRNGVQDDTLQRLYEESMTVASPESLDAFKDRQGMVHAVDNVNFAIEEGTTIGLVGESGCGKSTLGRTIIHLLESTDGQILYRGRDVTHLDKEGLDRLRDDMQIIFQDPFSSLNPRFTVKKTIQEPLILSGKYGKQELEEVSDELMDMVGIEKRLRMSYPHELDGGRRQRVGIARALALDPKFIVCDEPVSALDVSIQAQILNLLMDLQDRYGLTFLFVTHDLSVVRHISHNICVMYLGQLVESCPTDDLFEKQLHPYSKALLSAILSVDIHKEKNRILLKGEITSPINPKPGCRFAQRCPHAREQCAEPVKLREVLPGHFVSCCRCEEINGLSCP